MHAARYSAGLPHRVYVQCDFELCQRFVERWFSVWKIKRLMHLWRGRCYGRRCGRGVCGTRVSHGEQYNHSQCGGHAGSVHRPTAYLSVAVKEHCAYSRLQGYVAGLMSQRHLWRANSLELHRTCCAPSDWIVSRLTHWLAVTGCSSINGVHWSLMTGWAVIHTARRLINTCAPEETQICLEICLAIRNPGRGPGRLWKLHPRCWPNAPLSKIG